MKNFYESREYALSKQPPNFHTPPVPFLKNSKEQKVPFVTPLNSIEKEIFNNIIIRCEDSQKIAINTSEFSALQINEVLKYISPERQDNTQLNSQGGMNNIGLKSSDIIKDFHFCQMTWCKSLTLLNELKHFYPDKEIVIDFVINDFGIPSENREYVRNNFPHFFPELFKEVLKDFQMEFVIINGNPFIKKNETFIQISFFFESKLRNIAKKTLKTIIKKPNVYKEKGVWVTQIVEDIKVETNSDFRIAEDDILPLTNGEEVAVCNSIIMNYYYERKEFSIINIANYSWKCGYRGGAIALYSIFGVDQKVINLFYTSLSAETIVYDFF